MSNVYDMASPSQAGFSLCELAGKRLIENMVSKGYDIDKFKESINGGYTSFREDVNTANAGALYITGLANVIRAAVEPNMIGLELLQMNDDLYSGKGMGSIKLPKEKRVIAATVAEGGVVSYTSEGYESITVEPYKIQAASKITWEMVKYGFVSLIAAEAARVGKAIARKVDSDIINALVNVCTSANGNRVVTGGTSTRVSYNNLRDAIARITGFEVGGLRPTHMIVNAYDYAALLKDTDFKEMLKYATTTSGNTPGSATAGIAPLVTYFGDIKIIETNQIESGKTLFVDANNTGTFVKVSDVEVVDGRISGSVDTEIIALQSFGIGIQRTRSVSMVEMASS